MATTVMVPYDDRISLAVSEDVRRLGYTTVTKEIDGELFRVITIHDSTVNPDLQILERVDQQTSVTRSVQLRTPLHEPTRFINPTIQQIKEVAQDTHQKTYWQKFNTKAYGNRRKKSK